MEAAAQRTKLLHGELAPVATDDGEPLLLQGSPCSSTQAELGSPLVVIESPAQFLHEDEPMDDAMLALMDSIPQVRGHADIVDKAEFRELARCVGVPA